jgi:hypothetical protein
MQLNVYNNMKHLKNSKICTKKFAPEEWRQSYPSGAHAAATMSKSQNINKIGSRGSATLNQKS